MVKSGICPIPGIHSIPQKQMKIGVPISASALPLNFTFYFLTFHFFHPHTSHGYIHGLWYIEEVHHWQRHIWIRDVCVCLTLFMKIMGKFCGPHNIFPILISCIRVQKDKQTDKIECIKHEVWIWKLSQRKYK